jgi:hypothetical protein
LATTDREHPLVGVTKNADFIDVSDKVTPLITVWLEVRVLPGPPRTLSNLGISRFAPKGPELAGCAVGAVVSAETNSGLEEISAELSLALKSGCPATETVVKQRRGSNERRLRVEAKHQVLARPFGRHIAQPDNSHSVWKPSINGCLDQVGREEGERDRHVDPPHTASFAICNAFGICSRIGDEFIEPSAPPRNRCDQECAVLGANGAGCLEAVRLRV